MNPIEAFRAAKTFAVVGASNRQHKYGNKIFRALLTAGFEVYPLNPAQNAIEGHQAYPSIADLPTPPKALSVITPPEVTRQIIAEVIEAGVKHIWVQPGAENRQASALARAAGISFIGDGSGILVSLLSKL